MVWLVEGIYVVAMMAGIIWLTTRVIKFARSSTARKEGEARWAESFSDDGFQAFLETLRQKRDRQAAAENEAGEVNSLSAHEGPCQVGPFDIDTPEKG